MKRPVAIAILLAAVTGFALAEQDGKLMLFGDYNIPINPPSGQELGGEEGSGGTVPPGAAESVSLGIGYKFWGIFFVGGHFYNEIIYGADNALNINSLRPLGLFSAGLGVEIPLGGVGLLFDWQRMFTGVDGQSGIADFSNSFKWGLTFKVSDRFALEAYSRRFSNFSDKTQQEHTIYADEPAVNTFGAGAILRLF